MINATGLQTNAIVVSISVRVGRQDDPRTTRDSAGAGWRHVRARSAGYRCADRWSPSAIGARLRDAS